MDSKKALIITRTNRENNKGVAMRIENLIENLEKYVGWQLRLELIGEYAHCFQGKIKAIQFDKSKNVIEMEFKWTVQDFNYLAGAPQWHIVDFTNYFLPLTGLWLEQIGERIKFLVRADGHHGLFLPQGDSEYIIFIQCS